MNGCPDSDGDGVADNIDRCPEAEGDEANGGCPWADADGDGIPDKDDSCPDIAGTSENSGCPAEPTDLISFISNSDNRILFRANSSKLDSGDKETLDKLIVLLGQYESASIVIEGHASSDGSESYNQKLSEKRAASVETYLLDKGITNERLSTVGYGESKPIGNNNTVKGRADSRRVNINRSANVKVN
jgi:outer membrane protein OmpA-like peptidoglycan-associated protein